MEQPKPFSKSGLCNNCKITTSFILHIQFFANGSENFLWVCARCNKRNPTGDNKFYIPKETVEAHLTQEQIHDLPVIMPTVYSRCVRCGNRQAELHHWAPKGIFGDDEASQWPQDYLCKDCHDLWHRKVTPQLVNNG